MTAVDIELVMDLARRKMAGEITQAEAEAAIDEAARDTGEPEVRMRPDDDDEFEWIDD